MRTLTALALALVAATAGSAAAAPARPSGATFTDAAGDANGLDGAHTAGSQASLDVLKVRLTPFDRTRHSSGITVRVDLAAAPSTAPGTSYVLTATQYGCTLTIARTISAEGVSSHRLIMCGETMGGYRHASGGSIVVTGKSIQFDLPAAELHDASIGATLKGIEVSTSAGDPALGTPAPRPVDRAVYTKSYRVGS